MLGDLDVLAALITVPIFILVSVVWLLVRVNRQENKLKDLTENIRLLEVKIRRAAFTNKEHPPASTQDVPIPDKSEETASTTASPPPKPDTIPASAPPKAEKKYSDLPPQKPHPKPDGVSPSPWEWVLSVNWLVWVGGIALALGGIFIVKYSIDNNLLGPWSRIIVGILLGIAMLAIGEWFRRQPEYKENLTSWQYLPLAVNGAGLMTIYGAIYSGYAFYELYPPIIAVILLAMTAAGGLAYSLLLGPIMAAAGLIGAYAVPLLVATEEASTELLFLFLFAVLLGSLWIVRYRPWAWLGHSNIVASALWVGLWFLSIGYNTADALVVEIYLLALVGTYLFFFSTNGDSEEEISLNLSFLKSLWKFKSPVFQIYLAVTYSTIAGLIIALGFDHKTLAILLIPLLSLMAVFATTRNSSYEGLPVITHLGALLLLLSWPGYLLAPSPETVNPPVLSNNFEILRYIAVAVLIALFYVGFGAVKIARNRSASLGACHASIGPVMVFCISYWHFNGFGTAAEWALIAIVLSAAYAAAATYVVRSLHRDLSDTVLAIFALATTSALSLAFAVALENEWLSVAFALQVAATAWIYVKIPVPALRLFSSLLAIWVVLRLELDSEVLRIFFDPGAPAGGFLYAFVIAIAAFGFAWYQFRKSKTDRLVLLLESGLLLFWTTLIALSIRKLAGIGVLPASPNDDYLVAGLSLAEVSIQSVALLANGLGLYWLNKRNPSIVREWGWRILAVLGLVQLVFGSLGFFNPFFSPAGDVGNWYILDWSFIAYVLPALLALGFKALAKPDHEEYAKYGVISAGLLVFFYINVQIRHFFVDGDIRIGEVSKPEFYTYSLVWLITASGLMWGGIWKERKYLRQGALLLLLVTVIKVFLFDMAALDGLLRAFSFLGLGACLIGIGFLYQRFGKDDIRERTPTAD
ncbi:MAG: DUF2339 domain-containing protein [Proteobacteria bacterium]|nr:DUF2339 domain-containing protein [Pseudomonadota bacterium]